MSEENKKFAEVEKNDFAVAPSVAFEQKTTLETSEGKTTLETSEGKTTLETSEVNVAGLDGLKTTLETSEEDAEYVSLMKRLDNLKTPTALDANNIQAEVKTTLETSVNDKVLEAEMS